MFARYFMANQCFKCLMFMSSGPVELLLVLFELAKHTEIMMSCLSSMRRFVIVHYMSLLILFTLVEVTFDNYFLC